MAHNNSPTTKRHSEERGQHCEDGVPAYSLHGWTGMSVAAELRLGPLHSGFMPTKSLGINLKCLEDVLPSKGEVIFEL